VLYVPYHPQPGCGRQRRGLQAFLLPLRTSAQEGRGGEGHHLDWHWSTAAASLAPHAGGAGGSNESARRRTPQDSEVRNAVALEMPTKAYAVPRQLEVRRAGKQLLDRRDPWPTPPARRRRREVYGCAYPHVVAVRPCPSPTKRIEAMSVDA
jgi:hypothetical protein